MKKMLVSFALFSALTCSAQINIRDSLLKSPTTLVKISGIDNEMYEYTNICDSMYYCKKYINDTLSKVFYLRLTRNGNLVLEGLCRQMFKGGFVWKEYAFVEDTLDGRYTEYYANENLKNIVNYHKGVREGRTVEYYPNGSMMVTGPLHRGARQGEWRFYYDNGQLREIGTYEVLEITDQNEKELTDFIDNWVDDKLVYLKEGLWRYYDAQGKLTKETQFSKGRTLK